MQVVARFHSPFATKFGAPRQSGVVPTLQGSIVMEPAFRSPEALRGIEDFNFLWLLWLFSANKHPASGVTVRPPRLGGNERLGVFATRSPFRPSPVGLSSVRLSHVEWDTPQGPVLHVLGADLIDGTPIIDIKPYIAYTDAHPDARGGFVDRNQWQPLTVDVPPQLATLLGAERAAQLVSVLEQDPRPHYHDDPGRVYGMLFDGHDIRSTVAGGHLRVLPPETRITNP